MKVQNGGARAQFDQWQSDPGNGETSEKHGRGGELRSIYALTHLGKTINLNENLSNFLLETGKKNYDKNQIDKIGAAWVITKCFSGDKKLSLSLCEMSHEEEPMKFN